MIAETEQLRLRCLGVIVLAVYFALLLTAVACRESQVPAESQLELTDLPYASVSSKQALDLYLPPGPGPFPLVLYIHGGGFVLGDKMDQTVEEIRAPLLDEGYALASVNYRLHVEGGFPTQVHDVKTAVRWLRSNASRFRLDPDNVAAWGTSAGGNLAVLLGTSCEFESLEGSELGNADQPSCVKAVVDWFGPMELLEMERYLESRSCLPSDEALDETWPSLYLGGAPAENQELVRAANPITYITPDDPPVLIQHGTADCEVPPEQSQMLAAALQSTLGDSGVILEIKEGAGHYDPAFLSPANIRLVVDFLDSHLK